VQLSVQGELCSESFKPHPCDNFLIGLKVLNYKPKCLKNVEYRVKCAKVEVVSLRLLNERCVPQLLNDELNDPLLV